MNTNLTYYLAGPMSGIPCFNFPLFIETAARLRAAGFDIVSPAEMDSEATRQMARSSPDGSHTGVGESWGTCLARDVKIIADEAKGIIFLPGWTKSRGARLEAFTGLLCGHSFANYDPITEWISPIHADTVREALRGHMP